MKSEDLLKYDQASTLPVAEGDTVYSAEAKQRGRVLSVREDGAVSALLEDGQTVLCLPRRFFRVENNIA